MPIDRFAPILLVALTLVALTTTPRPALAEQESGLFSMTVAGIRAGTLSYRAEIDAATYTARGSARASGLFGAFLDAEVDTVARGTLRGGTLRPAYAAETVIEGRKRTLRQFRFDSAGVPSITRDPPRKKPQKHAAPAGAQAGTLDPMSAAFAILRNRDGTDICSLDIAVFDGARRSRIRQSARSALDGGGVRCTGSYSRIAGFSPREMAERVNWPLRFDYAPLPGGGYALTELRFPTSFGTARIRRR